ncbi:MAG: 16S rRNA (uracil(1498)-N(3))-methyltransferase [Firmicutes bacterium]|nr:16S rRNA (uracil(1498)-N(3))-methyltransferase [Bacillota bacterium]
MERFYVAPKNVQAGKVCFDSAEAHHLKTVLRFQTGTVVRVFDGWGHEYQVELVIEPDGRVWGQIIAEIPVLTEPGLKVTLAQGLAKREKNELVVQKATEIGVQAVIPLVCERSIRTSLTNTRINRLRRIAREAAKQCGRAIVPIVEPACTIGDLTARFNTFEAVLFCWEKENTVDLKGVLQRLCSRPRENMLLLVGPEGGFSPTEASLVIKSGAQPISLGPRILRTETAGLVALSTILYEFDELKPLGRKQSPGAIKQAAPQGRESG